MKKQLFTLAMVLMLVAFGVAYAQTTGQSTLPPSQQVDQSGQPETGPGPDVDVDTGKNAENGVLDVDVDRTTDSDTAATDRNSTTGTMGERENGSGVDVDVDTGARANGAVDVDVKSTTDADTDASGVDETGGLDNDADNDALPGTASELPAVALLGLLAMAAAFTVRFFRS
ncbi:MAG TPA: hypothetical protein VKM72_26210 [Thermoanaerobaculia bacterium]|nr:hypothetical protein [Thermoanaerobaculia bacterium]